MPDVFDAVAEPETKQDVFDSLPSGDVFDQLAPEKKPSAVQQRLAPPPMTQAEMARTGQTNWEPNAATAGTSENAEPQPTALKKEYFPQYWYGVGVSKLANKLPEGKAKTALETVAGINKGIPDVEASMTSAPNLAMLAVAPESKIAQMLISGVFLGQAIQGTPDQWKALKSAGSTEEKAKIATEMGFSYALPAAGMLHAGMRGKAEPATEPPTSPVEASQPEPAAPSYSIKQTPSGPMLDTLGGKPVSSVTQAPVESGFPSKETVDPGAVAEANQEALKAIGTTGVANRVQSDLAKQGKMGEVQPGEGMSAEELIGLGRSLKRDGVDPITVAARVSQTKAVAPADMAVLRAHAEDLHKAAVTAEREMETNPNNPQAKQNYDRAWNDFTQWHQKVVQPAKTASSDVFRAMQGETDLDTGTFTGLRRYLVEQRSQKRAQGNPAPSDVLPHEVPLLKKRAAIVRQAHVREGVALTKLGNEIGKQLKGVKRKTADEMRTHFSNRLKNLLPCE